MPVPKKCGSGCHCYMASKNYDILNRQNDRMTGWRNLRIIERKSNKVISIKAAVVKTKLDVYVLCERKSLFLIQNSIILWPFTAVVTQIIIFWAITPCRIISFLTFQRYVLSPPSGNLKKIFLGFKKNVFCKSDVPRKGRGTLHVGEKRNSFNDLFGKTWRYDLGADGRLILKFIFKKWVESRRLDSSGSWKQ